MLIRTVQDLDLSIVPESLRKDYVYKECIRLATQSRSENQRYGAVIRVRSSFPHLGAGFNHRLPKGETCPFKTSFFLHAEADAIRDALTRWHFIHLAGATLYVAGFLPRERRPLIRKRNKLSMGSCPSCAKLYLQYGLEVAIPSSIGWVRRSGLEALQTAQVTEGYLKREGISKRDFRKSICR